MFYDYFLKFTDEAEATSVIGTMEIPNESPVLHRDGCSISVIGTMYVNGQILTDADGMEYYEQVPVDGYHVNLRARTEQLDLNAYNTTPATPQRVWM